MNNELKLTKFYFLDEQLSLKYLEKMMGSSSLLVDELLAPIM
jgi:hypothetical protein